MGTNNFHIYQKQRSQNYNYIDRVLKSYVEQGGGLFHIYPMLSVIDTKGIEHNIGENGFTSSDPVFNENPKRKYSRETFDLWGVTQMKPPSWQYVLAGMSDLDSDEKTLIVHYNSMIAQIGRKIIPGDVVEISWLRDLDILGQETAQNKFYVVSGSQRHDQAWDPNYKFHLWELKMKPLPASPEYSDLYNTGKENDFYEDIGSANGGGGLDPNNTTAKNELDIMDKILEEAEEKGPSYRLHDEHHLFLDDNESIYVENRFIPNGNDGIPAELNCANVEFGEDFPENPNIDSYFLRIDFNPPRLFKRLEGKWQLISYDNRTAWRGVPNILLSHINNDDKIIFENGEIQNSRQNIKDLVKARVKKEHNKPRPWNEIIKNSCPDMDIPSGR